MNIGILIREARLKSKLTVDELAKELEISTAYLSRLENNKRVNPNIELIYKLERKFKKAFRDIIYIPIDIGNSNIIIDDRLLEEDKKKMLQEYIKLIL